MKKVKAERKKSQGPLIVLISEHKSPTLSLKEPKMDETKPSKLSISSSKNKMKKPISRSNSSENFKYEAYHIVLGKPEAEQPGDLFKQIKFFMIVGRVLGVFPFSGIFKTSYTQLYFQ